MMTQKREGESDDSPSFVITLTPEKPELFLKSNRRLLSGVFSFVSVVSSSLCVVSSSLSVVSSSVSSSSVFSFVSSFVLSVVSFSSSVVSSVSSVVCSVLSFVSFGLASNETEHKGTYCHSASDFL